MKSFLNRMADLGYSSVLMANGSLFHPLQSLYRRWIQGDKWRQRFYDDKWSEPDNDDLPSFATLLRYGFLERGVWGQEHLIV